MCDGELPPAADCRDRERVDEQLRAKLKKAWHRCSGKGQHAWAESQVRCHGGGSSDLHASLETALCNRMNPGVGGKAGANQARDNRDHIQLLGR